VQRADREEGDREAVPRVVHATRDSSFAARLVDGLFEDASVRVDIVPPSAIASDEWVPLVVDDGNGTDVLSVLEAVSDDRRTVAVAAAPTPEFVERANAAGADAVFGRNDAALVARIRGALLGAGDAPTVERVHPGVRLTRRTDGVVTAVGPGIGDLLGYRREEVPSPVSWNGDVIVDDDAGRVGAVIEDAIEAGDEYVVTYRVRDRDGDRRVLREHGASPDASGEIVAVALDVTAEHERTRELAAKQSRVRSLHEAAIRIEGCESPEEVYEALVDTAENVLEFESCFVASQEAGRFSIAATSTAAEPAPSSIEEGIIGRAFRERRPIVMPDADTDPDADLYGPYESAMTVPLGGYGVFQAVSREPAGFGREDLDLAQVLANHSVAALDRIARESELRQRERELRRQNDRLEAFASVVSHDLRNPLSVARGWTEQLSGDEETLERIQNAHERMEGIIDDVLALARGGDPVEDPTEVSIGAVADRAWRQAGTAEATQEVAGDARSAADPDRFQRLFENLFANAAEHAVRTVDGEPVPPTVEVGLLEDGFYVADDGPGVDPAVLDSAFESGVTGTDDGTGFGLAIVENIATAHGWNADLRNDDGARFEFHGVDALADDGEAPDDWQFAVDIEE